MLVKGAGAFLLAGGAVVGAGGSWGTAALCVALVAWGVGLWCLRVVGADLLALARDMQAGPAAAVEVTGASLPMPARGPVVVVEVPEPAVGMGVYLLGSGTFTCQPVGSAVGAVVGVIGPGLAVVELAVPFVRVCELGPVFGGGEGL